MCEKSVENFPFKYKELGPEENKTISDYMQGLKIKFVRVGPKGYFLRDGYVSEAAGIYNMQVSSDYVFVVTFPKSGTTWIQELVWLLKNDLDFGKAKSISLHKRFPFLEASILKPTMCMKGTIEEMETVATSLVPLTVTEIQQLPPPKLIKTHLPLSLLPPTLLDNTKVVYVARDPRDVAVSFFHHNKLMRIMGEEPQFKPYWNYFIKDMVAWSPYFEHLLEAWGKRNHSNLLFLFYEDLLKDLPEGIRSVANFLSKDLTENDVADLAEHLKFENFKNNKSVNMEEFQEEGVFRSDGGFVRKGMAKGENVLIPHIPIIPTDLPLQFKRLQFLLKPAFAMTINKAQGQRLKVAGKKGEWRECFDEEMIAQAEKWIEDNTRGTDFRFPHME